MVTGLRGSSGNCMEKEFRFAIARAPRINSSHSLQIFPPQDVSAFTRQRSPGRTQISITALGWAVDVFDEDDAYFV